MDTEQLQTRTNVFAYPVWACVSVYKTKEGFIVRAEQGHARRKKDHRKDWEILTADEMNARYMQMREAMHAALGHGRIFYGPAFRVKRNGRR